MTPPPEKPSANTLDALLQEKRLFPPPADFARTANAADAAIYDRAAADFESFWAAESKRLDWSEPWHSVLEWKAPWAKWFLGGKLNVAHNCVDRHAHSARRNKVAIFWEGEPGDARAITYGMLEGEVSRSLAPAVVPLRPFCGVMGVARAEDGEFITRPPGPFGGNMDVRDLSAGAKLYLPVLNPGALFSAGDAHAAQGDGEVCINGIECPADVTLRFHLHKHQPLSGPLVESAALNHDAPADAWIVVESATDPTAAARAATSRMIDLLASRWRFSEVHAYLLCSVAMHLRLSQVVNEPMFTVTAALPKSVLPPGRLF